MNLKNRDYQSLGINQESLMYDNIIIKINDNNLIISFKTENFFCNFE